MPRISKDEIVPLGIVYKLHHKYLDLGNNFYIGSTISERHRRCTHKAVCNNPNIHGYNYPLYQFIRENGGWNSWELEPIKKFENITTRELERHEQQTRDELKSTLNVKKSGLECNHLCVIDPKKYSKEYMTQYKQEHYDEIQKKHNQKFICDCGGHYTYSHKSEHLSSKKHKRWIALEELVPDD